MQRYTLPAGGTIETRRIGDRIEFITYNAEGAVISTVLRAIDEAAGLLRALATRG